MDRWPKLRSLLGLLWNGASVVKGREQVVHTLGGADAREERHYWMWRYLWSLLMEEVALSVTAISQGWESVREV
jgi:hypothetical protein